MHQVTFVLFVMYVIAILYAVTETFWKSSLENSLIFIPSLSAGVLEVIPEYTL